MSAPRIVSEPRILGGKPIIEGTRISVDIVLEELAGGASIDELAEDFELTPEHIRRAIGFAAEAMSADFIFPAASE